jgi:regulator of sigma E protease
LRRGVAIQLSVTPVWQEASQRPLIGVQIGGDWVLRSYTPLEAVVEGFRQAGELAVAVPRQLTRVISGVLPTDALSGPVGIVETSNRVVSNGWWAFWLWLSLLSFNLAIVNLLPLPVLDGGHLLFYAIEAVARRPLPVAVQSALMRLGVALLLGLFVALTLQDVLALLR